MLQEIPDSVKQIHPDLQLEFQEPFGCVARGIDVTNPIGSDTSAYLEAIMAIHGMVIFKDQKVLYTICVRQYIAFYT